MPGSPIKYDNTLLGASPEIAKETIEGQISEQCGADLCGVQVVIRPQAGGNCITRISPMPVHPGGTVHIDLGKPCEGEGATVPPDEKTPDEKTPDEVPPDGPTPDGPTPDGATPEGATSESTPGGR